MTPEQEELLVNVISQGDTERLKTLLGTDQEPPPEKTIQNLLTAATRNCQLDILQFLLDLYPSLPLNDEAPIRAAVYTGSIPLFKILLARDPSVARMPFERYGYPLTVACMSRQKVEYLRFLLEAGADPNQDPDVTSFPLALVAAFYEDTSMIDSLLQHGARLERSGALATAVWRGNELMLNHLFERGARLETDIPDHKWHASPLGGAVRSKRVGIARILMQHGADPNDTHVRDLTAIEIAREMSAKGENMSEMLELFGVQQGS